MSSDKRTLGNVLKGNMYILIATIFFGVNLPVVKSLIPEWMNDTDVTIFRLVGGAVLFWCASAFVHRERIVKSDFPRILLGGGLSLFAFIYMLNLAVKMTNPVDVSIISTLPPVFVLVIQTLFMHRRPSWLEAAGVVVSFAGAVIVILGNSGDGHDGSIAGDLVAMLSALFYAIYLTVLEGPTHKYRPISLLRWVFLAASIPCLFVCKDFFAAPVFHHPQLSVILSLVFIVGCVTFLSYLLINPAVKMIGSEMTSLYQYLVPVFAAIASVIMGVAKLHFVQVIAMVVIVAGMLLTNYAKAQRKA